MNNDEFIDKLKRAYMMEEEMAGALIDLCAGEVLPDDLPEQERARIKKILLSIKADTLRHRRIVSGMINERQ